METQENHTALMEYTPEHAFQQVQVIQQLMGKVMKDKEHYGVIPGCGDKPALLKAGAEKLGFVFRLAPKFAIEEKDLPNGHREYRINCELYHIVSGKFCGSGVGTCSTMESKYRYRKAERACPTCGSVSIIKGKAEFGGGWVCWKKKGGCDAKFPDGDKSIESQEVGKKENEDPADQFNTVLKMGKKRAHVDAILTATAASDIFTQDIEERVEQPEAAKPESANHADPSAAKLEEWSIRQINLSENMEKLQKVVEVLKGKGENYWTEKVKAYANSIADKMEKHKQETEDFLPSDRKG